MESEEAMATLRTYALRTARRALLALLLLTASVQVAQAVPSFARQTGQECIACHVSFPELTPYGRYFKLTGYTIGKPAITSQGVNYVPMAVMAQASVTNTRNNHTIDPDTGETTEVTQRNNSLLFSGASLFLAGKVNDYLGGFIQWTLRQPRDDRRWYAWVGIAAMDNIDIRVVGTIQRPGRGRARPDLRVHAAQQSDGAGRLEQHAGVRLSVHHVTAGQHAGRRDPDRWRVSRNRSRDWAATVFWKKTLYGEVSFYRTADGAFSVLRAGQDIHTDGGVAALKGYNPYWRFAYSHDWGPNSIMVGTYGMIVDRYPSNFDTSTPTDRFRDIAIDAQYQYITDPHTFTAQATYIDERQSYNASFPNFRDTGARHRRRADAGKSNRQAAYVQGEGDILPRSQVRRDARLFLDDGQRRCRPLRRGSQRQCAQARQQRLHLRARLPADPVRAPDVAVHGYTKFNGASTNYDGNGRNARDNNTLFFNVWVAF